jgi:hypothetical protein
MNDRRKERKYEKEEERKKERNKEIVNEWKTKINKVGGKIPFVQRLKICGGMQV